MGWKRQPAEAHLVAAHKEDMCAPRWLEMLTEHACHGIALFLDGVVPGGAVRGAMDRGLMNLSQQVLRKQQLLQEVVIDGEISRRAFDDPRMRELSTYATYFQRHIVPLRERTMETISRCTGGQPLGIGVDEWSATQGRSVLGLTWG